MTTLDGARVTPADASTAALYQYTPSVNAGRPGGTWLFWNLWQKYAAALGYKGAGAVATPTASIGDPCTVSGNCAFQGGECATNFPGGLCTATCTSTCPADPSNTPAFCADFQGQGGYCLPICNPSASACRSGYTCSRVAQEGAPTQGQYVCTPAGSPLSGAPAPTEPRESSGGDEEKAGAAADASRSHAREALHPYLGVGTEEALGSSFGSVPASMSAMSCGSFCCDLAERGHERAVLVRLRAVLLHERAEVRGATSRRSRWRGRACTLAEDRSRSS